MEKNKIICLFLFLSVVFFSQSAFCEGEKNDFRARIRPVEPIGAVEIDGPEPQISSGEKIQPLATSAPWFTEDSADYDPILGSVWQFDSVLDGQAANESLRFGAYCVTDSYGDIYLPCTDQGGQGGIIYYTDLMVYREGKGFCAQIYYDTLTKVYEFSVSGNAATGYSYFMDAEYIYDAYSLSGAKSVAADLAENYRYYLPYFVRNGSNSTGVAFRNTDTVEDAQVAVKIYSTAGRLLETGTESLSPRGQKAYVVGKSLNNEGWILVDSDQPLSGLCFVAATVVPRHMFDISLIPKASLTLQIPHVAQNEIWDSTVFIANPNDSATSATLVFYDENGEEKYSRIYNIRAMGSLIVPVEDLVGNESFANGSIEITANQGVAAFGLYDDSKSGGNDIAGISAVNPVDQY